MRLSLEGDSGWVAGLVEATNRDVGIDRSPVNAVGKEDRVESDMSCMSVSKRDSRREEEGFSDMEFRVRTSCIRMRFASSMQKRISPHTMGLSIVVR